MGCWYDKTRKKEHTEEKKRKTMLNPCEYICKEIHIKLIYVLVISTQMLGVLTKDKKHEIT